MVVGTRGPTAATTISGVRGLQAPCQSKEGILAGKAPHGVCVCENRIHICFLGTGTLQQISFGGFVDLQV